MHGDRPDSGANGKAGEPAPWIIDDDADDGWSAAGCWGTAAPPGDVNGPSATTAGPSQDGHVPWETAAGPPQGGHAPWDTTAAPAHDGRGSWNAAAPPPGGPDSPGARAGAPGGAAGTPGAGGRTAAPGPPAGQGSAAAWDVWGGSTIRSEPVSAWQAAGDVIGGPDGPDGAPGGDWFFDGDPYDDQDHGEGDRRAGHAFPRGRVPHLPAARIGPGFITFVVICAGVALVLSSIMWHPHVP